MHCRWNHHLRNADQRPHVGRELYADDTRGGQQLSDDDLCHERYRAVRHGVMYRSRPDGGQQLHNDHVQHQRHGSHTGFVLLADCRWFGK